MKLREGYEATKREYEVIGQQMDRIQTRMVEKLRTVKAAEGIFEDNGQGYKEVGKERKQKSRARASGSGSQGRRGQVKSRKQTVKEWKKLEDKNVEPIFEEVPAENRE